LSVLPSAGRTCKCPATNPGKDVSTLALKEEPKGAGKTDGWKERQLRVLQDPKGRREEQQTTTKTRRDGSLRSQVVLR